jgi:hypothetical protein
MSAAPEIVTRAAQPYAAVRARVTMADLGTLGSRFGEVFAWLAARGLEPAGAPFWRYNVIDMARKLAVDVAVPVAAAVDGDDHVVHPSELYGVTGSLFDWAAAQGLTWDMSPGDEGEEGERWGARVETYLTDPEVEPDMSKWVTELAFRLADE